jgi:hypothetical protein
MLRPPAPPLSTGGMRTENVSSRAWSPAPLWVVSPNPRNSNAESARSRPPSHIVRSKRRPPSSRKRRRNRARCAHEPGAVRPIVIPEGAGLCQGESALVFSSFSASVRAAPGEGRRSRRSARSVARTNGLDRGPARRRLGAAGERCVNSVVVRGLQCDVYVVGARPVSRLPVIPSPECSGMEQCAGNTRGQSKPRPRRIFGGQTITRPRACCVRDAHAAGWWVRARMCPSRSP